MNKLSAPSLPMLYGALEQLDATRHLGYGLRASKNFLTAAKANAIPLAASEFSQAITDYPIVFGPSGANTFPIAVTSLIEGKNLFVDTDGKWRPGSYIPGYLRRYPFWMTPDSTGEKANFSFDPNADFVIPLEIDSSARPLFDFRGQPNTALSEVINFCQRCLHDEQLTHRFMMNLEKENILRPQQVRIEVSAGKYYELGGFRVIDNNSYHQLPDSTLAAWVKNGYASLIALHQWSMTSNWQKLLGLHYQESQRAGQGV